MNEQVKELKNEIESQYRTDGMTLPAPPKLIDPELEEKEMIKRKQILNPTAYWEDKIPDMDITVGEWHNQLKFGIPPENATKEAKAAVAHHKVSVEEVDGKEVIVVTAPELDIPKTSEKQLEKEIFGDNKPTPMSESFVTAAKPADVNNSKK